VIPFRQRALTSPFSLPFLRHFFAKSDSISPKGDSISNKSGYFAISSPFYSPKSEYLDIFVESLKKNNDLSKILLKYLRSSSKNKVNMYT
jgi:hypothetical protein